MFRAVALAGLLVVPWAAGAPAPAHGSGSRAGSGAGAVAATRPRTRTAAHRRQSPAARRPNEMGRIPILEYHLVGDGETRWQRDRERFSRDLQELYDRGYRPISLAELLDRRIELPAGQSPVIFTFDDSSPSQFRYIVAAGGRLEVDPTSALGIWLDFHERHPDWRNRGVFCVLPAAAAGHAFFGLHGIEGQRAEWRFTKLRFLVAQGFELCNHTLWHADLAKYPDDVVEAQIARANMAIDSAVPGYRVRVMALPFGVYPRDRALAQSGAWTDPRTHQTIHYHFDAILLVGGGPVRSPYDPAFDPLRLGRVQVTGDALEQVLDRLDRTGERYVSDGDPRRVAPASGVSTRTHTQ
jgi:Polysaccharide deacetylase